MNRYRVRHPTLIIIACCALVCSKKVPGALGQSSDAARKIIASDPRDAAAVDDAQHNWWKDAQATRGRRIAWWTDARFGCFIHWMTPSAFGGEWKGNNVGTYSEHMMRTQRIPLAEYKEKVVAPFDPEQYNADDWIRLIKSAGMKFVVLTVKHHDGVAMWPSDAYPYDIRLTQFYKKSGRDPVGELAVASHKAGLKFGIYYSHAWDWEDPDALGDTWDYPVLADTQNIFTGSWESKYSAIGDKIEKYVDGKAIPQLKELIAKYHPDLVWFDTPRVIPPFLQLKILKAVRQADPNIVINGRGTARPLINYGDYDDTADRPAEVRPYKGDWEGIPTCNEAYGYHKLDKSYKPVSHFIQLIAKIAAKGGNTLLNIGPMGNGVVDPDSAAILTGIGKWMDVNGDSIHGTQRTPLDRQAWGDSTIKRNTLYLHVFDWPKDGKLVVGGLQSDPTMAYLLVDPAKKVLKTERLNANDLLVLLPIAASDSVDSVVVLQFGDVPKFVSGRLLATNVSTNRLLAFDGQTSTPNGFVYGDGKTNNYWVAGFADHDHTMHWNARLNVPATFKVIVKYSMTGPADGGTFNLQMGTKKLHGEARLAAAVSTTRSQDAGQEAVGAAGARGAGDSHNVLVSDLGDTSFPAGELPIDFVPDEVIGKGANLFEINLTPVEQ